MPPVRAVAAFLAWASWGALWAGVAGYLIVEVFAGFMPYLAAQPGFSLGLWRWLAFANWAMVTAVAWYNYERTRQLLLHGRRQGLAAATILAGLFTIVLVLNALGRRARPRPELWAAVPAAAVVSVFWVIWATAPRPAIPAPIEPPPALAPQRALVLVSLEGADLPWLLPAMDRGDMPFLRARRDEGAWGQVRSIRPHIQTGALATLSTGCSPSVHGVVGRRTYRLPWLSRQPVALLMSGPWPNRHHLPWRAWQRAGVPALRRAPLWEIAELAGMSAGVAGWPGQLAATWHITPPLAADAVPFETLDAEFQAALEPAMRHHPDLADLTRAGFALTAHLGAQTVIQQQHHPADALVVNFDLPARVRPYWTTAEPDTHGQEVLRQAARLLDDQIRNVWSTMAGRDVLLAVVSPYGMAPPSPWRRLKGMVGTPDPWQVSPADSPDGFLILVGSHVKPGVRLRAGRLADVTATLLYLMELPMARDMAGRVQLDAVEEEWAASTPLRLVISYPVRAPRSPGARREHSH